MCFIYLIYLFSIGVKLLYNVVLASAAECSDELHESIYHIFHSEAGTVFIPILQIRKLRHRKLCNLSSGRAELQTQEVWSQSPGA